MSGVYSIINLNCRRGLTAVERFSGGFCTLPVFELAWLARRFRQSSHPDKNGKPPWKKTCNQWAELVLINSGRFEVKEKGRTYRQKIDIQHSLNSDGDVFFSGKNTLGSVGGLGRQLRVNPHQWAGQALNSNCAC